MDMISTFYADDHDRLDSLFETFRSEKNSDPQKARQAFSAFKAGLERHIVWEEEILFPQFEEKAGIDSGGPTEVMRFEHQWILNRLNEIASKLREGLPTEEDEAALTRILAPHNQKEEIVLYPAIDGMLDDGERRQVFASMEEPGNRLSTDFHSPH